MMADSLSIPVRDDDRYHDLIAPNLPNLLPVWPWPSLPLIIRAHIVQWQSRLHQLT